MIGALVDDRVRAILVAQAMTAYELKQARANLVLRYSGTGMKAYEMWAQVDRDTADLAKTAALADAEARALSLSARLQGPDEGAQTISEGDLFE